MTFLCDHARGAGPERLHGNLGTRPDTAWASQRRGGRWKCNGTRGMRSFWRPFLDSARCSLVAKLRFPAGPGAPGAERRASQGAGLTQPPRFPGVARQPSPFAAKTEPGLGLLRETALNCAVRRGDGEGPKPPQAQLKQTARTATRR
ncbi:uncharacterized protein LOC117091874 isoform X2 [Trachypithecus francoisi]|nr:uncharacterized protein LOC117091874 isoform X2 [Trachypithecus francoisi]